MYVMQRFIQSEILLIILTVWGVFHSKMPYVCILAAGLLMMVLTRRSLSESRDRWFVIMQTIVSGVFAVVSGGYVPYLIFFEVDFVVRYKNSPIYNRSDSGFNELSSVYSGKNSVECENSLVPSRNNWIRVSFPAVAYGIVTLITSIPASLPHIICNIIILIGISTVMYGVEWLIAKYMTATQQISKTVSVTAVNEMYVKNLNRELMVKNYLADKNARLQERENISRNIHNSVGHSITAAVMALEAADMLYDSAPDKAREKMNTANERIKTGLGSIRHAVRVLDSENKFISMGDLVNELQAIADDFVMDTMIKIHVNVMDIKDDIYIYHEHTEFLTGALQELLTNGVRHGNADIFTVTLTADSGHVKLVVADNGCSDFSKANQYEKIQNCFGLKKLISYAKRSGGMVTVSNENGFRTEITLRLLKEELNHET